MDRKKFHSEEKHFLYKENQGNWLLVKQKHEKGHWVSWHENKNYKRDR